jgi:DNA repair exonuclease SbcCD ATPase subunit
MDAIAYALFGNFPSIQHRRTNVSYLIRSKPKQEDTAKVKLSFEINGNSYEVERVISQNSPSTATLKRDGVYLQSQPQRVTEEIVKLLKMDYDLFSRAVYSQQNGLEYFLNLRSADRKKEIDNLLGLDKFSEAKENVTSLANRIKDMVKEDSKAVAEFDESRIKEQLEALEKEIARYNEAEASAEKKLAETKTKLTASEAKLNAAKEELNKKNKLLQEIRELKGKTETFTSEIKKIDAKGTRESPQIYEQLLSEKKLSEAAAKEAKDSKEKAEESGKRSTKYDTQLQMIRKDYERMQMLQKELEKLDKKENEKNLQIAKDAKEKAEADLARYSAEKKEGEKNLKELESHFGKCPVCEKELEENLRKKLIEDKKNKLKELQDLATESEKLLIKSKNEYELLNNNKERIGQIENRMKEYAGIEDKIKELERLSSGEHNSNTKLKAEYELKEKAAQELKERTTKLQAELELSQTRERYAKELEGITLSILEKENGAKSIEINDGAIDSLYKEVVALSSDASRTESELRLNKRYAADKMQQKKEKEDQYAMVNRIKEEISKKKKVSENLEKFSDAIIEAQTQLRNRLVESINRVMGDIWPELYPYKDYSDIMLDAVEDDYILKVNTMMRDKMSWEDVELIASGGERSTACLAMRIAFSLVLAPNIKWLILDEPTHNLDQQAVHKMVDIFGETLPKIIDQVFIITHEDLLKEVNGSNVYVLNRDKGADKETEASIS